MIAKLRRFWHEWQIGSAIDIAVVITLFLFGVYYFAIGNSERGFLLLILASAYMLLDYARRLMLEVRELSTLVANLTDFIIDTYRLPKR